MVSCTDRVVGLGGQLFARNIGMRRDCFERDDLDIDGLLRHESRKMTEKCHAAVIEDGVTVCGGHGLAVYFGIPQTKREDVGPGRRGSVEKRVFKLPHAVSIRCGAFGKEDHGETLAKDARNVIDLLSQS